jgi:hypothetical protein
MAIVSEQDQKGNNPFGYSEARINPPRRGLANGITFSPNDNVRLKAGESFAKTLKKVLQMDDNIRKRLYCDQPFCVPGFLVLFSLV